MGGLDEIAVWGDELLEKGDPLGQIIALARASNEQLLLTAQREYERAHFRDRALKMVWKNGLIDEIHAKTEIGRQNAVDIAKCPATRFLRVLDLEVQTPVLAEDPIPAFVEHGLPPSLRHLKLWLRAGRTDLTQFYSVIPNIERLDLWRPEELGIPDLPQLRVLRTVGFSKHDLTKLEKANLPRLHTLAITAVFWEELAELALPNCPELHTLAVTRPPWEPWFSQSDLDDAAYCERELRALLESPLAGQVAELEFRDWLKGQMVVAIVHAAPMFERFARVRFRRPKAENLQRLLTDLFGARLEWLP